MPVLSVIALLGPAYNEFGYYEHLAVMKSFST